LCIFPRFIWYPEGPETSKTWKKEFSGSQKLNATNRDFEESPINHLKHAKILI
jgi:hypothetical protein